MDSEQKTPKQPCSICENEFKFICSICKKEKYCSKECQKTAWPRHKKVCKPQKQLWELNEKEVQSFIKEEPEIKKDFKSEYIQNPAHEDFEEFTCHICEYQQNFAQDPFFYHS